MKIYNLIQIKILQIVNNNHNKKYNHFQTNLQK